MKHLAILLGLLFAACGGQQQPPSPAELVVATVGDAQITASDFAAFIEKIPEGMRQGATPLAINRNLLKSLIDKELLVQEAKSSNLENGIWFIDELTNYERSSILRLYERREIITKLNITPEMVDAHYRETRRDRSIRLGGIMIDPQQQA
ncbi:SurA N-terminal domain-containing protein, partial [bacterium]|nr:SurA N-terminal domain-containing protein [bacterium]